MRLKIRGSHLKCKVVNKHLSIREQVEVAEKKKDGLLLFLAALWVPNTLKGNPDKKNMNVCIPLDLGDKLNVHKMFRRRPEHLLNTLLTLNLRPVPREESYFLQ